MKVSGPKYTVNINFTKIITEIMQTLYTPLENGPHSVPVRSSWLLADSPFNGMYSHIQFM